MMITKEYLSLSLVFLTLQLSCGSPTYDVIIIGAGASGIAAASKLLKKNVTNVLVLEAEGRIGGRINSVKLGDGFVDLGGEWVAGNKDNVAYDLAIEHDVIEVKKYTNMKVYHSSEVNIPDDVVGKFMEIEKKIFDEYPNSLEEGVNVGDFCTQKFRKLSAQLDLPKNIPHLSEDMFESFRHVMLGTFGVLDWYEPSAVFDSKDLSGMFNLYAWKGVGYKTILEILSKKIPKNHIDALEMDDKILLNKEVIKIQWNNLDNTIKIRCKDGSGYVAKKVVFTPSIGVLKASMDDVFEPALPEEKRRAIRTLGVGGLVKVWLEFSTNWWNVDGKFDMARLVWDKKLRESANNSITKDRSAWITDMSTVLAVDRNPNVLSVNFDGSSLSAIEKLDDQELLEGIEFAFQRFFGHKFDVQPPIKMLRSDWLTNPHFLGVISFQTIESRKKPSSDDLAKPVQNGNGKEVLFFAGEATSRYHYGSVHGAIETGFREADRIC